MKFTIQKNSLQNAIQIVSKAVAVRTTKQVLSGILLNIENEQLIVTAYDLDLGIRVSLTPNEDNLLNIEQQGQIVLPARYLVDVVRKLPDDRVSIQVSNNYMTEIKSGSALFHLHGIDAAEFPKLPVFGGSSVITISSDLIKGLIKNTSFATSNSEVRPILTGIHIQFRNQSLTFTATDGLRLATKSVEMEDSPDIDLTFVLPGKSLVELSKILPDTESKVNIQFTDSHSLFVTDNISFYTRLIDGAYPDTSRIIPVVNKTQITVPSTDMLGSIDRAALIARDRESYMVRLEIQNETMTVSSSSPEIGNVSESLSLNKKTGEDMTIAFNAKYVLDALRSFEESNLDVYFNGSNQAFVIKKVGDDSGLQLISPVLWR